MVNVNNILDIEENFIMTEVAMISDIYSFGDELMSEGVLDTVVTKVSEFFQKAVNTMVAFVKTFRSDLTATIEKKRYKAKLKKMKEELKSQKDSGVKYVGMIDHDNFIKTYEFGSKRMIKILKKITEKKYKSRSSLNDAMDEFTACMSDMESALESSMKNRVKTPINDAIVYVEKNLNGQSRVERRFIEVTRELRELGIRSEKIFKNTNLSEDKEVLHQKVSIIRTIITKITGTLSRWFRKFVMTVVFFFA